MIRNDVRTYFYEHPFPRPMQRCTMLIVTAAVGFVLMAAGFVGYLSDDADPWTWLFALGAVVLAASYILIARGSRQADAELSSIYEEEAMEGYVYYMDGEPSPMEATITDLTRRP